MKGGYPVAEQILIIEDGTLTKFECDDYVEVVCIPDCVKNIGYRELQFLPYWDPVPFGRPVIIYGKPGSEAERYTKDNVLLERTTRFTYAGDDDRHLYKRRMGRVLFQTL